MPDVTIVWYPVDAGAWIITLMFVVLLWVIVSYVKCVEQDRAEREAYLESVMSGSSYASEDEGAEQDSEDRHA